MKTELFTLHAESELPRMASFLAPHLKKGDVVILKGNLGAGKTAFTRALINHLSPTPQDVPSPTFTLVQVYDLPLFPLWHFDLYRLEEKEQDILELGWDEARQTGVSIVEWPDRLGRLLPQRHILVEICTIAESETGRQFRFVFQ